MELYGNDKQTIPVFPKSKVFDTKIKYSSEVKNTKTAANHTLIPFNASMPYILLLFMLSYTL